MKTIRFVWSYLRNYRLKFIFGLIFAGISVIFMLILPQITQFFVDSVLDFSHSDTNLLSPIWIWLIEIFGDYTFTNLVISLCVVFIICALLKNITEYFASQNFFYSSSHTCGHVRRDCFKKLSHTCCTPQKSEVFVHFTNDISDLFNLIYRLFSSFFTSSLKILLILTFLFFVDIEIGLCISVFIFIMLLAGFFSNKKALEFYNEIRNRRSRMEEVAEEAITEMREIKLFNREEYALTKFGIASKKHYVANIKGFGYLNKVLLLTDSLKISAFFLVVVFSALKCFDGLISVGFFVLIFAYTLLAINSAQSLIKNIYDINLRLVRISRVMNFIKEVNYDQENIVFSKQLDIKIEDVRVLLNERKLFDDFNLELPYGKTYGIVIKQGEGKSALAKMLLRFYEITSGNVYIGGQKTQDLDICQLRNLFSYISQEPYIFEGTILNNVILFDNYDEAKFKQAIQICDLEKLIEKLGADYYINEKGVGLTSQEKQKINFARAIYKNAPILIIDSSFNKFNNKFSQKMIKRFIKFYKNRTVIILSIRPEDIEFCNEIIFVEQGKVIDNGTFKELVAKKDTFYYCLMKGKPCKAKQKTEVKANE
ncbi:MAG: ABC transporter ATP-binding protein [Clostridia bacterium]|nr:ABC transporter ATP-binding protein [Clostridia bacterium]